MGEKCDPRGLETLIKNLRALPKTLKAAVIRHGLPDTPRAASQSVFSNVFLHLHAVRTHRWSLKKSFTMGLGIASLASFLILAATGIILMVYFKPSTALAYDSVKDINYVVPGGYLIRNVHRWTGHLMVVLVLLHMVRVVLTGSYRKPREFNWVVGIILLVLTFGLAFTGYCLPWDQLGYWAITIGSNIAASPSEVITASGAEWVPDVGAMQRMGMLGARTIGDDGLLRFYILHTIVLPIAMVVFLAVHFWRIRKDGGMSRPDDIKPEELEGTPREELAETVFSPKKTYGLMALVGTKSHAVDKSPENTVRTWPNLFYAEMTVMMAVLLLVLVVGLLFDAPLSEIANPAVPENPAKAPWYFLGLQECVSYSSFSGGILVPTLILGAMAMFPFLDRGSQAGRLLGGQGEKTLFSLSLVISSIVTVAMLAFSVKYGWMRNWWPNINQLWIIAVNPGTVLCAVFSAYSLGVLVKTKSPRSMVVALMACIISGFVILSYFAYVHRGPNWDFYWFPSDWPKH